MSRHSQSQSKSQPQSNRRQLLPVASAPATTPPHASLGFAAVRLAIQARGPDGPIQFLDICLHDDWQPNSSGLTLHLAGSDATWAPDTSNGSDAPILLGWPVDSQPRRYIAVSPECGDAFQHPHQDTCHDEEKERNLPAKRPQHESWTPCPAPKRRCRSLAGGLPDQLGHCGDEDAGGANKRAQDSTNYLVELGLVRFHLGPPGKLGTTHPNLCVVVIVVVVIFVCYAEVWAEVWTQVPLDAANRTINIHLTYASIARAILLDDGPLYGDPGWFAYDSMGPLTTQSSNELVSPPGPSSLSLSSAGDFVPEKLFFWDVESVLRHLRSELTTIDLEGLLPIHPDPPAEQETLSPNFDDDPTPMDTEVTDSDDGPPTGWAWPSSPEANRTAVELYKIFQTLTFPYGHVFTRAPPYTEEPREDVIAYLAHNLTDAIDIVYGALGFIESVTADNPGLEGGLRSLLQDNNGTPLAVARVHDAVPFLHDVAAPRLRTLHDRVTAGLRLLRQAELAKRQLAASLAESAADRGGWQRWQRPVSLALRNMVSDTAAAERWLTFEAGDVRRRVAGREEGFAAAVARAEETWPDGQLPAGLVFSRWRRDDDRADPYGAQAFVREADRRSSRRKDGGCLW
ncbi:hypothetical protein CT0861_11041 [Colletotrichum tofieldiae]|uniref:Uncharacterized protein n=1 Tax=Colletotrichum tofieldiae TaxID=708197 RepID=A0A166N147_9PEZI|nr:hypothetical protein CT0861_11041 [Colletotrichum tofieldiae]